MIAFNIFRAIGDFFTNVAFVPFDALRHGDNWWTSNIINFLFMLIGFLLHMYWTKESIRYRKTNTEDLAE